MGFNSGFKGLNYAGVLLRVASWVTFLFFTNFHFKLMLGTLFFFFGLTLTSPSFTNVTFL